MICSVERNKNPALEALRLCVCVCWWPCPKRVLSPESFCFDWISWTKSKLMWFSLKQVKQNPSIVCLFYHRLFCRTDLGKWTKAILKGKIHDCEPLTVVTFPAHLKIFYEKIFLEQSCYITVSHSSSKFFCCFIW